MALSFRKSIKAGPLKINLSKSGIGLSTGMKGAHVGMSSRGRPYVSGGANGVYYRKSLGKASGKKRANSATDDDGNDVAPSAAAKVFTAILFTSILGLIYRPLFLIPASIFVISVLVAIGKHAKKR